MTNGRSVRYFQILILILLVFSLPALVLGQGRGRGGGGGRGIGSGMGNPGGGPPMGVGVDRGLERSSERSNGNADRGRETASTKSNGRSNKGLARARVASENLKDADKELRNHPGIAQTLHQNANDLRSQYAAALASNPNLKFGQFVAATRLGQNLGRRHPNITRAAILAGLASGKSIGRTLQDLGLSERQASEAKKQAESEIKQAKK